MAHNPILYVGADDSNHAGSTKGEIIVATFSFDKEDSIVRDFHNTRDSSIVEKWIAKPGKDYRFSILTEENYRHSSQNLPLIVPNLIDGYLAKGSFLIKGLNIYFDGKTIPRETKQALKEHFIGRHGIERVVIDSFIKKVPNGKSRQEKHPHCPPLVYYADIISHNLYRDRTFEQLSTDPRLVPQK